MTGAFDVNLLGPHDQQIAHIAMGPVITMGIWNIRHEVTKNAFPVGYHRRDAQPFATIAFRAYQAEMRMNPQGIFEPYFVTREDGPFGREAYVGRRGDCIGVTGNGIQPQRYLCERTTLA